MGDTSIEWTDKVWNPDAKRIIASNGYVLIRVGRGHHLADVRGYAYEHLVVWVSAGFTRPSRSRLLHHISGVKTDNRLGNLKLMSRAEHNHLHNSEKERKDNGQFGKKAAGRLLDGKEHNEFPA